MYNQMLCLCVFTEDIARSMMYVGGVHSLISMMTKYDHHTDMLKHCCTALGTFASHGACFTANKYKTNEMTKLPLTKSFVPRANYSVI